MKPIILQDLCQKPEDEYVVAIGNFDGVHLGHRALLELTLSEAEKSGFRAACITFEPHPALVLGKISDFFLIQPYEKKYKTLSKAGLEQIFVCHFDSEFSQLSAFEFLEFLFKKITIRGICVGYDFRFGSDASGNLSELQTLLSDQGVFLKILDAKKSEGEKISSRSLRKMIQTGNMQTYKEVTGSFYEISSVVIEGRRMGRTLGFPTANFLVPSLNLAHGVYASLIEIENHLYPALTHVGNAPTFSENKVQIESHIPGFNKDIYGKELTIFFCQKIRNVICFRSSEELKKQIESDISQMRAIHV